MGKWKTFFLRQFQILCNYYANKIKNIEKIEEYIEEYNNAQNRKSYFEGILRTEYQEFVKEECCEVLYFNAWEYDNNDDPIKSLMYFLIENYELDYKKIEIDWKELGKKVIKFLTGIEYGEDCLEKTNLLKILLEIKILKKCGLPC